MASVLHTRLALRLSSEWGVSGSAYHQDGTDWPVFKPNRFLSIRDLAINFLELGTVPSGKRRDPPTEVKHDLGEPPALLLVLNSGCQPEAGKAAADSESQWQ